MARSRRTADEGTPAPEGGDAPRRPGQRYVISHLVSPHPPGAARADAVDLFSTRMERVASNFDVVTDVTVGAGAPGGHRRLLLVQGEEGELARRAAELTRDTVVEPELHRVPAVAYPALLQPTLRAAPAAMPAAAGLEAAAAAVVPPNPGTGAVLQLNVRDPQGNPVPGGTVTVTFCALANPLVRVSAGGIPDAAGAVSVPFDANVWRPVMAAAEPAGRFWTASLPMPQSGQTIQLTELPAGPVGWWHLLSGATGFDPQAGHGIRVGVIDTGVGPHPALKHAVSIGASIGGRGNDDPAAGLDVQRHGTHVSGIIGARPVAETDFGGIAPAAELFVARVFPPAGNANQLDITAAIYTLCLENEVDIINLSLAGDPSIIEQDAMAVALQQGTVCVCAAGNDSGPVSYPAGYPEAIAVSALGLPNTAPAGSMPDLFVPGQPDRYGQGGIFLASFSNTGPQLLVAAGGNGIISTIPAVAGDPAPYADMSGTSMASPLVAGVLAAMLSRDPEYQELPRGPERSAYARALLARRAIPVLRNPLYEGRGLARMI